MTTTSLRLVRRTAHQREERRIRIMGMVRAGFSYEAIAQEEQLTRERIRQIVAQSLEPGKSATKVDLARVQAARLEPALRLAARGVEDGKLTAINALLRVLDRMDKYGAVTAAVEADYANIHERLMAKINRNVARLPPRDGWTGTEDANSQGDEGEGSLDPASAPQDKNLESFDSDLQPL